MAVLWRVWATALGVILAVLIVFLTLSTFQFSRANSELVGERLVVLADRMAAPFEAAAKIGLPVADVRNATGLLERAKQTDERIRAIYVFDSAGRTVHASEGSPPDISQMTAIRSQLPDQREWHGEVDDGFVAGVNFPGPGGKPAGGIGILYPSSGNTTSIRAMAAELSVAALAIFCLSGIAAGLLLRLSLGRTIAAFDRVEQEIAGFERDSWSGNPEAIPTSGLRSDLDAAFQRYRKAASELRQTDELD